MRMSPRAVKTIRRSTEKWMVDEIQIWRPAEPEEDDESLRVTHVTGEMVYQGIARVAPTRGPREQAIGEGVIALRDADFLIPHTAPLPWRDDEVKMVHSEDPALAGRWFRITDVRVFSQQAARRFSAIQAQPSRQWVPVEEEVVDG